MVCITVYYYATNFIFSEQNVSETITNVYGTGPLDNEKGTLSTACTRFINRIYQDTSTFVLKHGTITTSHSYESDTYIYSVGEKFKYTVISGTGEYYGYGGYVTIEVLTNGQRKVTIKLKKNN